MFRHKSGQIQKSCATPAQHKNMVYDSASFVGLVAQLVEQRIENPRVGGSIPPQATTFPSIGPMPVL